jgi:hypothetical protein
MASDARDVVDDAGGGIDLHDEHGLDRAGLVLAQPRLQRRRVDGAAPIAGQDLHGDAQGFGHAAPAGREKAAFEDEHLVAAREEIAEHRLPAAMAVGDVDVGLSARAEQLLQIGETAGCGIEERAGIDVDGGPMHGGEDLVGHRGRSGYAQEFAAVADGHGDWLS